jgi:cyclopropane fatty-acyl-phospholipid synthase-like methyltransferase
MKPYSESSEQNKVVILEVLRQQFSEREKILEIGSGTGQHAVYFAKALSHLQWFCSDTRENLDGISAWMNDAGLDNVTGPIELDVNRPVWDVLPVDGVFSANTVHIMSWSSVENMFAGIARYLIPQGVFCLYGPFNYNGMFTSESNARFDQWLKARDIESGVRDFEALNELAAKHDMTLLEDFEMPENNRILVWQKARVIDLAR